jgi:hypothetical protein
MTTVVLTNRELEDEESRRTQRERWEASFDSLEASSRHEPGLRPRRCGMSQGSGRIVAA